MLCKTNIAHITKKTQSLNKDHTNKSSLQKIMKLNKRFSLFLFTLRTSEKKTSFIEKIVFKD